MDKKSVVPEDFGSLNGTEVSNKDTFFGELDDFLGRVPSIEYILVRPLSSINLFYTGIGLHYNSYGHSAVRYKYNGEWYIMNIVGKEEKNGINMVTFNSPEQYFFGTRYNENVGCAQQKGLYNRSMIGVRIYDVPEEKIEKMHEFFLDLQKRNSSNRAGFLILPHLSPIVKLWNRFMHKDNDMPTEFGNCSYWTSKGLLEAGLVTNYSNWPKSVLINIIENSQYEYDVVSYRRIEHAKLSYGIKASPLEFVAPFNTFRSLFYLFPENFAKAIVEVPANSIKAEIVEHEPVQFRSSWRNMFNGKILVASSVAISSYWSYRFFRYTYKGGASWAKWATRYETWWGEKEKSWKKYKDDKMIKRRYSTSSFNQRNFGISRFMRFFRK